mgnify:FL=1
MIIITKHPNEIKSFLDELSGLESEEAITREIQSQYAKNCFMLEKKIEEQGGTFFFDRHNEPGQYPVSMIRSSDKKTFIFNGNSIVKLNLFQLRSKDRRSSEDILVEPFYPSFQATIVDIYEILKEKQYPHEEDSYHFSAIHPRNRQRLRARFRTELPQCFTDGILNINSFENFQCLIHQLDAIQLRTIFKTNIIFIDV